MASELAPKAGYQVVLDLTSKTGATTLASEVQRLQAANPDVLFLVQYTADATVFQNDAKRAGWSPKVIATDNGAYSDETWLQAQKKSNGGAGWLGRDPTAIDLVHDRASWKKVNEIYKKQPGPEHGRAGDAEITGLLWMADVINRAAVGGASRAAEGRQRDEDGPRAAHHRLQGRAVRERPERARHRRGDPDRLGRREAHAVAVGSREQVGVQGALPESLLAGARQQAEAQLSAPHA